MTTTYKIPGYFTSPASKIEALTFERERAQMNLDKVTAQYTRIIRELDDEIAALRVRDSVVDVIEPETPQTAVFLANKAISEGKRENG